MSPTSRTISSEQVIAAIVDACSQPNHMLHILHELQQQFRHISDEAVREVYAHPGLPVSQTESAIGFYSLVCTSPHADATIFFSATAPFADRKRHTKTGCIYSGVERLNKTLAVYSLRDSSLTVHWSSLALARLFR